MLQKQLFISLAQIPQKELLTPFAQYGILGAVFVISLIAIVYLYKQVEKNHNADREEWHKQITQLFEQARTMSNEYKEAIKEQTKDLKEIIKESSSVNAKVMNTLDRINSNGSGKQQ